MRVNIETKDQIAYVRLNRPEKHNGVDPAMLQAIIGAGRQLRRDRAIRGVVIVGNGESFCSGLDFKAFTASRWEMVKSGFSLCSPFANRFQKIGLVWRDLPVPVIASIHGACYGAGLQLAMGCDVRFAAADAKISIMEAKWGLIPDMSGSVTLREVLPIDVAKILTMTGKVLDAEEAAAIGLVTEVVDDPTQAAEDLLAEIATRSPDSVAASKMLFNRSWNASASRALRVERRLQRQIIGRENQRIAMARNLAKKGRPFKNRRFG